MPRRSRGASARILQGALQKLFHSQAQTPSVAAALGLGSAPPAAEALAAQLHSLATSDAEHDDFSPEAELLQDLTLLAAHHHAVVACHQAEMRDVAQTEARRVIQQEFDHLLAQQRFFDPAKRLLAERGLPLGIAWHKLETDNTDNVETSLEDYYGTGRTIGHLLTLPPLSGFSRAKAAEAKVATAMHLANEMKQDAVTSGRRFKTAAEACSSPPDSVPPSNGHGTGGAQGNGAGSGTGGSGSSGSGEGEGEGGDGNSNGGRRGKGDGSGDGESLLTEVAGGWEGTTMDTPADIARRIMETNEGAQHQASLQSDDATMTAHASMTAQDPSHDEELTLSPEEQQTRSMEQLAVRMKKLDGVFDILASVPWLDEDVLEEKELKGVAMMSLLGTLEESGFNIRNQVERIWAGEHDHDMIHECESAQDQLAVDAILFYTNKIKTQYGPPDKYLPEPKGGASQKPVRSESILQAFAGDAASKEGKRS